MEIRPEPDPFSRHAPEAEERDRRDWGPIALARARAEQSRNGSARCVKDASGTWWVVTEQPSRFEPDDWYLVFESDETTRYVREYPAEWMRLDAERLAALELTAPRTGG